MKKIYHRIQLTVSIFLLAAGLLNAQFANGVIITNEGTFGQPNANISYIDAETQQVTNNVYSNVNGENLGDVLQNIGFYQDKAYLVLNNSNKVVVVDRETFVKQAVVTENILLPRYIAFAADKFYVTNSVTNSVSSYSISDNSAVSNITVAGAPEEIEAIGNHVFAQIGWYASGNTVSVIDAATDTLIENIVLSEVGLNGMVADNEYLYVLTTGADFMHIYKINGQTLEIESDVRFTSVVNVSKITLEDGILYFTGNGNKVYGLPVSMQGEPVEILTVNDNTWSTFYGFNVIQDYIFSGDANGFVAPSIVTVYNLDTAAQVMQFSTGIGTNGFYGNFGSLNIHEISSVKPEVKVYPNPASEWIKIDGINSAEISVLNIHGQLVKSVKFTGNEIAVSDLTSGLYFFVIQTESGKTTKKVLIR